MSESGYYKWNNRDKKDADEKDFLIRAEFNYYEGKRGSPLISNKLSKKGYSISQSTVAKRMRKMELSARKKKKFLKTTDSNHDFKIADNLLNQDFTTYRPNAIWVTDITYIKSEFGWIYLVVFMDLFSRKIVGWETSETLDRAFVIRALNIAILRRDPPKGLIIHSDRGVHFACNDYRKVIEDNKFLQSMSAKGNCYDNAVAESFFKTLKYELISDYVISHKTELDKLLFRKIEVEYNRYREHSTLDYQTPDQVEENYYQKTGHSMTLFS